MRVCHKSHPIRPERAEARFNRIEIITPQIAAMPYTWALRRFAFSILSQSTDNKLKTHTAAQNAQPADR